jgi:predicted ATPase
VSDINSRTELFKYGATWARADFHLHTKADKEFEYTEEENSFVTDYVNGLKAGGIQLGVITNHNKFVTDEFKALRKRARKEEIFLLPGVELSVADGSNGIHTLIVFSEQWLENGHDYINQFINVAFEGKVPAEYEHENGRSSLDLITTIKKLEGYHRDFFIVFAHVEQSSGLWRMMDGGRLKELGANPYFRNYTLGFQKVRGRDQREKVQHWLGDGYPAEVEGSDCKSIEDIGKGEKGFIKLGAFSFDALKFALVDKENRVSVEPKSYTHSHIESVRFTGGTLSGQTLHFSPELNALIGIRGSGKSSVLEVIRYALDIPFGEKSGDTKYKRKLVEFTLGSGGKVEIDAVDRYGQRYTVRRVINEMNSEVLIGEKLQPGISIRETVIHKPIYFGQKDLSSSGKGFEKDLVDKLLGAKLDGLRRSISVQKVKVGEAVDRLSKMDSVEELLNEQRTIKQNTEHRLQFYSEHGVEEKLQQRLDFDADIRMVKKGVEIADGVVASLEGVLADHEDEVKNFLGYRSKQSQPLFDRFYADYGEFVRVVELVKSEVGKLNSRKVALSLHQDELDSTRKGMVEAFAEIERKLSDELKSSGSQNISSTEFLALKKRLSSATQLIAELSKQGTQKKSLDESLLRELSQLNALWHQEFELIKAELDKVGASGGALSITSAYKGDKQVFLQFMKDVFKGSGIREATYQSVVDRYPDFAAIYNNLDDAKTYFGSNPQVMEELLLKNLKMLLSYQVPNQFTIMYRGKALQHHSLGQRASALILFVLNQQENDLIMIDQPEDDLDNQTIYEDVIKLIQRIKPSVQFIFATHNPNIPVLGDAEQVHACSFMDDQVSVVTGSVDDAVTQSTIVNIMEGGQEAFNRRKEIYQIWKS